MRPQSVDIPEPLTDEQIEVMTIDEAMAALTHIAQARQTARLDEATEARLQEEFKKVKAHHRKLLRERRSGGGDG